MFIKSILATIITLGATAANASSLVTYNNFSNQDITVNTNTLAPESTFSGLIIPTGTTITVGEKTISITDSHTPCLRDGAWFNMPYGWYMNLSVDGQLIGQLCSQLEGPMSTTATATSTLTLRNTADNHYQLNYSNTGSYSSLYLALTHISTLPVIYSW